MRIPVLAIALFACFCLSAPAADYDTGIDAFSRKDYRTAVANLIPLAMQNDARAQFATGVLYQKGAGVLQDNALAWYWFSKAMENGHDKALDMRKLLEKSMTDQEKQQAVKYMEE